MTSKLLIELLSAADKLPVVITIRDRHVQPAAVYGRGFGYLKVMLRTSRADRTTYQRFIDEVVRGPIAEGSELK
jgi:hypothetical protein